MVGVQRFAEIVPSEKKTGWKSKEQKGLLVELFKSELISSMFFLSGGTSLAAMYLGHRESEDVDLFTNNEAVDIESVWKRTVTHLDRSGYPLKITVACGDTFASGIFVSRGSEEHEIKVDLVHDCFAVLKERPIVVIDDVNIRVDIYDNIVSGKFSALLSRGAVKDMLDVSAIFTHALEHFGDEYASNYLKFILVETAKRDMLAEDIYYIKDVFCKIEQKHKENFNPQTLAWIQAALDKEMRLIGMNLDSCANYDGR